MPGHAWESGPLVGLTGSLRTEGTPSRWRSLEDRRKHPGLAPPHTGPPSYLQLQPGGGLCAHPVGIGAPQALSTEGPVASWPLTDEVQQILVGKEERGGRP